MEGLAEPTTRQNKLTMLFKRQKKVTQQCIASQDPDFWIIGSEGERLRPRNWPERVASTFMSMDEFANRNKIVSQCVSTIVYNDRQCLKVRKSFQQDCHEGWRYIEHFALSNHLTIIDNHGITFTVIEETEACPELNDIVEGSSS